MCQDTCVDMSKSTPLELHFIEEAVFEPEILNERKKIYLNNIFLFRFNEASNLNNFFISKQH